jgi:hypothetical protein
MAKESKPHRPKDINKLAKLIADISTGEAVEQRVLPEVLPDKKKRTKS